MQRSVATCHRCGFRIVFRHGDWMHADVAEDGFLTYRCLCAEPLGDHPELGVQSGPVQPDAATGADHAPPATGAGRRFPSKFPSAREVSF